MRCFTAAASGCRHSNLMPSVSMRAAASAESCQADKERDADQFRFQFGRSAITPHPGHPKMGGLTMSHAKQASKRRSRATAGAVLGVAGALSLAGGASEATLGPTENTAPVITLGEEEISDVSLSTFYVFDNENAGAHRPGLHFAKKTRGHGGCAAHRGCGGCAVACGGCGGCASCASAGGPDGM